MADDTTQKGLDMKKQVTVEWLLRWAFREELPKALPARRMLPAGFGGAWGSVTRMGELGDLVQEPDVTNRFGVVPDLSADRGPKVDALQVWWAMQELEFDISLSDDWNPLSDMGDLGPLGCAAVTRGLGALTVIGRQGEMRPRVEPQYLLRKHAILGACPIWEAEVPTLKYQTHANGKHRYFRRILVVTDTASFETEVDGYDTKRGRPYHDAYRKPYLDPDPADVVIGRGEYAIWHAAMQQLGDDLRGGMDDFEVLPLDRSPRPWDEPEVERPKVWIDPRPAPTIPRVQRPIAGPPLRRDKREKKERGPRTSDVESALAVA